MCRSQALRACQELDKVPSLLAKEPRRRTGSSKRDTKRILMPSKKRLMKEIMKYSWQGKRFKTTTAR